MKSSRSSKTHAHLSAVSIVRPRVRAVVGRSKGSPFLCEMKLQRSRSHAGSPSSRGSSKNARAWRCANIFSACSSCGSNPLAYRLSSLAISTPPIHKRIVSTKGVWHGGWAWESNANAGHSGLLTLLRCVSHAQGMTRAILLGPDPRVEKTRSSMTRTAMGLWQIGQNGEPASANHPKEDRRTSGKSETLAPEYSVPFKKRPLGPVCLASESERSASLEMT